ncbi:putative glucosamine-6-phosphate isomerase [Salmonella enterica subsp. enterica serovar Infantis str. SARB27]|uniref:Galactosamine-6-phosphate isomerase n=2 Tax=Salmonella infantis TaxID=595 RepID=A0A5Y7AMJ2_SALIN|nr:galactosamine-6-phosphate isomerase [Salmonella enterica]ECK9504116.1 galactosamine-6-phosphate isomerase [Salmonella enterica subsp. enterica serovar Infantis str. CFSAN000522]EHB43565.1 putative glucosamine-6-phosphate isomerase [Salmonella enterica subsp. enterica serovar Infantis str. SARB27]ELX5322192.1 galactosamine-6-phosphate isomerase [Salmonella enterica]QCV26304.1 galactosamine-6-phosphate isomerase [Salmonella enterica subsp. enterica serovar Infantis]QCV30783.1 galactosamine-6-
MQTLQHYDNYCALSERASDYLAAFIQNKPDAVICLATGGSPLLTYRYFVEKVKQRQIDISQVSFVKLDEWVGIPLQTPGTCEAFLQQHIVRPLNLREDQLIGFRSQNVDEQECERVTALIAQRGGLDLCILGLGKNGHLGLNEPGVNLTPRCHISKLDAQTRQHDMLKTAACPVEYGITLGLKDILNAREILLLITGEGKQAALEKYLTANVTTALPASFLWLHDKVTCLLDGKRYSAS